MGSLLIASALAGLAVAAPPHYNTQSRVLNKDATNTLNRQEGRPVLMTSGYLESQARRSINENLDAKDDEKIVVEIADETSGNATSSVVINGTSVHEVPTKVTGEKNIGQVLKDIVDNIKGVMDKLVAGVKVSFGPSSPGKSTPDNARDGALDTSTTVPGEAKGPKEPNIPEANKLPLSQE